ncbi:MAG: DUF559 domain-containing protein [Bacteroidota bacterium]
MLKQNRKYLRQNLTLAEALLWKQVQHKKLEARKFRRQHGIDNYIVDFYCTSEKLIIALDGEVQQNPIAQEKDRNREAPLEVLEFEVLQFENKMVFEHLPSVIQEIKQEFTP